jgi:hypothetical protein
MVYRAEKARSVSSAKATPEQVRTSGADNVSLVSKPGSTDQDNAQPKSAIGNGAQWVWPLAVFLFFVAAFSPTAKWEMSEVNVDAVASSLPAWSLTQRGTLALPEGATVNPWVIDTPNGYFSNRPPGSWLVAIPAYLVFGSSLFSTIPSTATAVVVTAAALTLLFMVLRQLMPVTSALASTVVFAFGTSTWAISAAELWPHGTGQLLAASSLLALAAGRPLAAGVHLGLAIVTRPVTALFAAVAGLGMAIRRRAVEWRWLLGVGGLSMIALLGLMTYNQGVFGSFGVTGGYGDAFEEQLTGMPWGLYLANLSDMFLGPRNGILFWSPVVLVGLIGAAMSWQRIPRWAKVAALAGLIYLLVHARLNRASGGMALNYRYPLEPLMMAAPMLAIGANAWFASGGWRRRLLVVSVIFSVIMQAFYVFALDCVPIGPDESLCGVRLGS